MAEVIHRIEPQSRKFADEISRRAGFHMWDCYLCGKCTAGCPVAFIMTPTIYEIMQMVQMGRRQELLSATGLWHCVSCETCSSRCPKECKPSKVVDVLREMAMAEKKHPAAIDAILAFHRAFMNSVRRSGRLYEIGMIRDYKLQTLSFFQDLPLGFKMFSKGKLHLISQRVKDKKTIEKIFRDYWDKANKF